MLSPMVEKISSHSSPTAITGAGSRPTFISLAMPGAFKLMVFELLGRLGFSSQKISEKV